MQLLSSLKAEAYSISVSQTIQFDGQKRQAVDPDTVDNVHDLASRALRLIQAAAPKAQDEGEPDYWEDKILAEQNRRIMEEGGYMAFTKHEHGELYPCMMFKDNETRAQFLKAYQAATRGRE